MIINRAARLVDLMANGWVISLIILAISILHLTTEVDALGIHELLRRLYYIPIILAAYRFGAVGGFIVSLISGLAYAPHLLLYMGKPEIQMINQLMEILLFIIVGMVTGTLSAVEKLRSNQLEYQLTQVKRLENEVRIADRLAAVGQLASGVAHEIRNPLGIIGAAAQLANDKDSSSEDINESITVILKEVNRANQVVSRLLDFARPHTASFELINLKALIQDSERLTRQYALNKGVFLKADVNSDDMYMEADSELIKQMLVNLLMNSIQATPESGKVAIKTNRCAYDQRPGFMVEISDTGSGIPKAILGRIFDPFFTTKDQGTGLGLSIVHSIVIEHGGYIQIESEEGRGTSIYTWLPSEQKEA